MTLVEFLLARIEDDRTDAEEALDRGFGDWEYFADRGVSYEARTHISRWHPARVLAECKAKRRIVERETERLTEQWRRRRDEHRQTFDEWLRPPYGETLRDLASVYADHPDYAPEWSVS